MPWLLRWFATNLTTTGGVKSPAWSSGTRTDHITDWPPATGPSKTSIYGQMQSEPDMLTPLPVESVELLTFTLFATSAQSVWSSSDFTGPSGGGIWPSTTCSQLSRNTAGAYRLSSVHHAQLSCCCVRDIWLLALDARLARHAFQQRNRQLQAIARLSTAAKYSLNQRRSSHRPSFVVVVIRRKIW